METSLNRDVLVYLYKCLLRRRQALTFLKPIGSNTEPFNEAIDMLMGMMYPEDICEADKQMRVSRAKHLDIYVDASVKDHDAPDKPNKVAISFIIYEDGKVIYEKAEYLGSYITLDVQGKEVTFDITVNVAEYLALIKALEFIIENEFKGSVTIYSDSLLVVNQINFTSSTRAPKLIVLRDYARRLKERLREVDIVHLDRELNASADALARASTDVDEEE